VEKAQKNQKVSPKNGFLRLKKDSEAVLIDFPKNL
jgi:hypothetical protein